jgi:hypothetical protein
VEDLDVAHGTTRCARWNHELYHEYREFIEGDVSRSSCVDSLDVVPRRPAKILVDANPYLDRMG